MADDWTGRTATEIAAAVRAGEATAGQVVADHLDRIAKLNGELAAFIRVSATIRGTSSRRASLKTITRPHPNGLHDHAVICI